MKNQLKVWLLQHGEKSLVFADQGLVSGVNFSIGILLARWLGIEIYGVFTLAWMVVLFISGVQQSFLIAPLYALTEKQENKEEWLSQLNFFQVLFSILSIPLTIAIFEISFSYQPEWDTKGLSSLVPLLIAIYTLNDFFRRSLFREQFGKRVLYMDLLGFGLQPVLIIVLNITEHLNLLTALGSILITQSMSLLYYFIANRPLFSCKNLMPSLKELWQYSRYLLATSVLQWSSGNYFILISGAFLGSTAVGTIRIAQNLMGLLHVVFLALENLIPVRAASVLKSGGSTALFQYLKKTFGTLLIPILSLIGVLIIFQQEIICFFYGELQQEVGNLLIAFSIIYLMVFLGTLFRFAIRTLEMNHMIFKSYVMTTIFSLLLAQFFVTKWGVMGVVIGLVGTHLISLSYFFITLKNTFKWKIKSFM